MDRRGRLRALCLAAAAGLGLAVALGNALLRNPLGAFREEYAGGGSCKLRGLDAFELLLLVGQLAFPLAAYALAAYGAEAWRARGRARGAVVGAVAALAVLAALWGIGFVGPLWGLCP